MPKAESITPGWEGLIRWVGIFFRTISKDFPRSVLFWKKKWRILKIEHLPKENPVEAAGAAAGGTEAAGAAILYDNTSPCLARYVFNSEKPAPLNASHTSKIEASSGGRTWASQIVSQYRYKKNIYVGPQSSGHHSKFPDTSKLPDSLKLTPCIGHC
mgnify:CR=1 FL=1